LPIEELQCLIELKVASEYWGYQQRVSLSLSQQFIMTIEGPFMGSYNKKLLEQTGINFDFIKITNVFKPEAGVDLHLSVKS